MKRITDLMRHDDAFVSVSQLADYWGVCEETIRRDIKKGALRVWRVGSSDAVRIPISEARRYGRPDDPAAKV